MMPCHVILKDAISNKNAVIGVVGLGHIGLPIAALFARKGFRVLGGDINKDIIQKIRQGKSTVRDEGMEKLVLKAVKEKRLMATTDIARVVRRSSVIFIVVQTPVNDKGEPNLEALENACKMVGENLAKGKLIIIESTIPPGTTKDFIIPLLEKSGLKAGKDFYLAYSPERAMPTKTLEEIRRNSRIVGGINKESAELTELLYKHIVMGEIITESIGVVEMVKIIENTYRDVNIALANEIALLGEKIGIDARKAIELANKHPRVHIHSPGAGVGGHCIPKDPYFLIDKAKKLGLELKVISSARKVNEEMPQHVFRLIKKSLTSAGKDIKDTKVSVLGMAYKGNTDDIRGTPSEKIIKKLLRAKFRVNSHDPYVSHDFGGNFSNDLRETVEGSDCVVIVTDHDDYKNIDLKKFARYLKKPGVIIDSRGVLNPEDVENEGITYFGIGR